MKQLVEAGVGVVSFANNHVMDFGMDAFLGTLDLLRKKRALAGTGPRCSDTLDLLVSLLRGFVRLLDRSLDRD